MKIAGNSPSSTSTYHRTSPGSTCLLLCLLSCYMAQPTVQASDDRDPFDQTMSADTAGPISHPASQMNAAPDQDRLTQQLWFSRITAPDPDEEIEARLALKRAIQQIRSVKFTNENPAPTFSRVAEPQPASESSPIEPVKQTESAPVQSPTVVSPEAQAQPLPSTGTEAVLKNLLQDPSQARDPLKIAELLFLSGRTADAAPFYQKALDHTRPADRLTDRDRAWILFQLGNCLRETDMAQAQDAYTKLIAEYPDSPWTELAKAYGQLASWYRTAQPRQLLASREP